MIQRRGPPSQSWRTFLRNHVDAIAAVDLCVVPTLTFERLFAFLVLGHEEATAVVCGDPQSVGGVAGSTDGRGIPVEHGANLFGARQ